MSAKKKNPFVKTLLLFGSASTIAYIVNFLLGIYTRRILGPELFGLWLSVSIILTYGPLLQLGTLNALNRELPFEIKKNRYDKIELHKNTVISFLFTLPLAASVMVGLVGIILLTLKVDLKISGGIIFASILLLFSLFSNYTDIYFRSYQKFNISSRLILFRVLTLGVSTLISVYYFGFYGMFIGMFLSFIVQILVGRESYSSVKLKKIDSSNVKYLIKVGFPIMLVGVTWSLMTGIDRLLIISFLNPKELGYYGVALLVFSGLMLLPNVLTQIIYPKLVGIYAENENPKDIYPLFVKVNLYLLPTMTFITLFVYYAIPFFVELTLPSYSNGIKSAQLLALGIFPLSLAGMAANILNTLKKQKIYLKILFITGFFNILISYILLNYHLSIASISLGTSLSYFIYALMMNTSVLKIIK